MLTFQFTKCVKKNQKKFSSTLTITAMCFSRNGLFNAFRGGFHQSALRGMEHTNSVIMMTSNSRLTRKGTPKTVNMNLTTKGTRGRKKKGSQVLQRGLVTFSKLCSQDWLHFHGYVARIGYIFKVSVGGIGYIFKR